MNIKLTNSTLFKRILHITLVLIVSMGFSSSLLAETLTGTLDVVWGDSQDGSTLSKLEYTLAKDNGEQIPLLIAQETISSAGGITKVNGKEVIVEIDTNQPISQDSNQTENPKKTVNSLTVLASPSGFTRNSSEQSSALTGTQEYVSILCKFSDVAAEPQNWNYFDDMYGIAPGQLGHYWGEVSSDKINLAGSRAFGGTLGNNGWYTLPSPKATYVGTGFPNGADLNKLFTDCVAVADAHINFTNVKGINLMFNDDIGPYAWGGARYVTLDGVTKSWPTTWEPDWGWAKVAVIAHEMGHSFGLPHSNNSDGDTNPYDNPWTVMSDPYYYTVIDSIYGTRGQHVNSYEKDALNWIGGGEMFTAPDGETHTLNIDSLSDNLAGTGAYRMIKIPFVNGNNYYTVETRKTTGEYEAELPGTAVIIHSVDESRNEPAWLVDESSPADGEGDSEGVMWKVGETFTDVANNVEITVNSSTDEGFEALVHRGGAVSSPNISSPNSGSTLPSASTTFQLNNDSANVTRWAIWMGTSSEGNDLGTAGADGTANSITFNTIPTDGSTIYITLFYRINNGIWIRGDDYTYTASTNTPTITAPSQGSTLPSASATFQLNNDSANVTRWAIWMGTSSEGNDLGTAGADGTANSITFNTIPTDGSTIYITLFYRINNGIWIRGDDYTYIAPTN